MQEFFGRRGACAEHTALRAMHDIPTVDILDESDELLSHKFQLIYSWGDSGALPSFKERINIIQAIMQALHEDGHVNALLRKPSVARIHIVPHRYGALPEILLLEGAALDETWPEVCVALCEALMEQKNDANIALKWMSFLDEHNSKSVVKMCTDWSCNFDAEVKHLELDSEHVCHLLMLRGLLASGILRLCLLKRHRVHYGTTRRPGKLHTDMACPYKSSDTPCERAVFKHPDVSLLLTHLAYSQKGMSEDQVKDFITELMKTSESYQNAFYSACVQSSRQHFCGQPEELNTIDSVVKIDLTNVAQFAVLCKYFRYNYRAVNFWLETRILPSQTKVFESNLRQTAWHLASSSSGKIVGFSGTNDNRPLWPLQVQAKDPCNASSKEANGRMFSVLLRQSKCTFVRLPAASSTVAQNVLDLTIDQRASALIDAGAQLAGMELSDAAIYIVEKMMQLHGRSEPYVKGVMFFASASQPQRPSFMKDIPEGWCVLDSQKRCLPKQRSPIKEADALVIFDEARCRGSDMKLKAKARAVMTLGPRMERAKFMQAAARMRQLSKDQSLVLTSPSDVCGAVMEMLELNESSSIDTTHVLQWVMMNTAHAISMGFTEYLMQAKHFVNSVDRAFFVDKEDNSLKSMYHGATEAKSIDYLINEPLDQDGSPVQVGPAGEAWLAKLRKHVVPHRLHCVKDCNGAAHECERELQHEEEEEREVEAEAEAPRLRPRRETAWSSYMSPWLKLSVNQISETAVVPLRTAVTYLGAGCRDQALLAKIDWPASVMVTENFLYTAVEADSITASNLRKAHSMLVFPDGSILLISDGEANGLVKAKRINKQPVNIRVTLTHLAFIRWSYPRMTSMDDDSDNDDDVPLVAEGALLSVTHNVQMIYHDLASAIVSLQLFSGEEKFKDVEESHESQNTERCKLVTSIMFGNDLGPAEGKAVGRTLVALRGRAVCWPASDLERICYEKADQHRFS